VWLRVVVAPIQTVVVPVIADGIVFTVTCIVLLQPPVSLYVMVAVPALMPNSTPVMGYTYAIEVLLLLHVPPLTVLLSGLFCPPQIIGSPVIVAGTGYTLATTDLVQPDAVV